MYKRWFSRQPLGAFWAVSIFALLLYSFIYIVYPFSQPVDDLVLNVVYLACVLSPAWIASAVLKSYDPNDAPIRIWKYFSIGFWAWAAAEFVWVGYNLILGEVPHVNLSDPLYLAGYILMTFAIAGQYRLARYQSEVSERFIVFAIWISILLLSTFLFFITSMVPPAFLSFAEYVGAFLNIVNGVGDLTLAIAGLIMISLFRGGALGRPWWGFIILAVADVFYGWLAQAGAYDYQTISGDLLRLASDLIYMLAYLVISHSFLRQLILLRFGPSETSPTIPRRK